MSGDDSTSNSSSDEELFEEMDQDAVLIFQIASVVLNQDFMFNSNEILIENSGNVDHTRGVKDVLGMMSGIPHHFQTLTNFTVAEFQELCEVVVPIIKGNARSTGAQHVVSGRPPKLTPEQRLLNFILYMKHDNTVTYDAFSWNWASSSLCDDALFVASCLNEAIGHEIRWPTVEERAILARQVPHFPGCIGIIDGTLVKCRRPRREQHQEHHRRWFNGRKKMYCYNNTVVVDHSGLIIFLDPGYPGSFHDVSILVGSEMHRNWQQYFEHDDHNFQYVLGDPGYLGTEHYVMRRLSRLEIADPETADQGAIAAFNRMHAGYRVQVEWGIGGMKRKWRRLMKRFDLTIQKYTTVVTAAALMTNFLHRRRQNLAQQVVGERMNNRDDYGWDGDF